jgi:hypothetical protein
MFWIISIKFCWYLEHFITSSIHLVLQDMDTSDPRLGAFRSPARILQSPGGLPPRGPYMNGMKVDSLNGHCYFCISY